MSPTTSSRLNYIFLLFLLPFVSGDQPLWWSFTGQRNGPWESNPTMPIATTPPHPSSIDEVMALPIHMDDKIRA